MYLSNSIGNPKKPGIPNSHMICNKRDCQKSKRHIKMQFIKAHYKTVLTYTVLLFIVIVLSVSDLSKYYDVPLKNWFEFSSVNFGMQSSDTHLQGREAYIYEEMYKKLQNMQQAATYLQVKQQFMERKTVALERKVRELTTRKMAEYLKGKEAKQMIDNALLVYDADKLGLKDYALESSGAVVTSILDTKRYYLPISYSFIWLLEFRAYSNPRLLIQPDVNPGNCFAFEGSQGRVRIFLSNTIYISSVTLEHAPFELLTADEVQSAPKSFEILGMINAESDKLESLGMFEYSIQASSRQTFFIPSDKQTNAYRYVEFAVYNNHGNDKYTCVYRLRVHGKPQ